MRNTLREKSRDRLRCEQLHPGSVSGCAQSWFRSHTHTWDSCEIYGILCRHQETIDGALESRRDQEEGGELDSHEEEGGELDSHEEEGGELDPHEEEGGKLDSHEEVKPSFAGPGEIKRREVSWTLKRAQKRSRAGKRSWAQKVGQSFASVVSQQQCYGHCPCDPAPHSSWNSN